MLMLMVLTIVSYMPLSTAATYIPLTDFEDITGGARYGQTGLFYYEAVDDNTSNAQQISNAESHSGDLSLMFDNYEGVTTYEPTAYLNLTEEIGYVGTLSFWFYFTSLGSGSYDTTYAYFRYTGINVLRVSAGEQPDTNPAQDGNYGLYMWDNALSAWTEIGACNHDEWYKAEFIHNGTNKLICNIYNVTNVLKWSENHYSSPNYWDTFDQVYFVTDYNNDAMRTYWDDFNIGDQNATEGHELDDYDKTCDAMPNYKYKTWQPNYCNLHYLEIQENFKFTGTIYGAEIYIYYNSNDGIPIASEFSMRVNNNPVGTADSVRLISDLYQIQWVFNTPVYLDAEKPLFTIFLPYMKCLEQIGHICFGSSSTARSGFHDSITWAYNNNFEGSHHWIDNTAVICWYFEGNQTTNIDPIPPDDLLNWTNRFNSEYGVFCEAYGSWYSCYYRANTNKLELIYNITDDYMTDSVNYYKAIVYDIYDTPVHTELIFYNPNQTSGHLYTSYKFKSAGTYYLLLWNTSDNGLTLDTVLDSGNNAINVCPEDDGGGGDDWGIDIGSMPIFIRVIIAIMIILCMTLSPLALGVFISKAGMNINIPSLLYIGFFFFGVAISCEIGALDWAVFFIILFGLIIAFAIIWLHGKDTGAGE